jgi:putative ubiquitin-RnfH superfamily antitoxin RatB of RatAB toxin-antitoxin module
VLRVEVILAWPRRYISRTVFLPQGARVSDAIRKAELEDFPDVQGYSVYGVLVQAHTVLCDGDRVELLRPLLVDPKEARRKRAQAAAEGC